MTRSSDRRLSQKWDTSRLKSGLKPYSQYVPRHSVPWLPPIPSHWSIVSNRIAFQETDQTDHPNEAMLSVTIGQGVILQSDLTESPETDHRTTLDRSRHKLVEPDDIVYNKMRAWQGAIGTSEYRGLISPDYVVEKPRTGVNAKYAGYLFRTPIFAAEARRWSYGIASDRWRLRHKDFKSIHICLPPADEQAAIVRYLDHADEIINRYISAKQRLIALLEEQRQAVIQQAVTRGLTPEVRLESSGIEWLEDIPEHWETRSLKTICRMKSGDGITAESIEEQGDYPVYGGNGVRGFTRGYTHDGEFVLIGRQGALCGNIHVARGRFWASEHAVVASLAPTHDLNWFAGLLASMNLNQYSIAAAQPGLSVERVMNLRVPVPPAVEQATIGNHIINAARDTDVATTRIARQIDLMNEYRIRLIADVVTGQLDVRDAAVELPT